jgi:hypothetical protein
MERRTNKALAILSILCLLVYYVEFFGTIAFFSPTMFLLVPTMVVITLFYCLPRGIAALVDIARKKHEKVLSAAVVSALLIASPIWLFVSAAKIHDVGIYAKFWAGNKHLSQICEEILINKPSNKYFIDNRLYIWPHVIGPTRFSIIHQDGVVYISFDGLPGEDRYCCPSQAP